MAKKKQKPKGRVELQTYSHWWIIRLCCRRRWATVTQPRRLWLTKRAARDTANAWSELTGWPMVEK